MTREDYVTRALKRTFEIERATRKPSLLPPKEGKRRDLFGITVTGETARNELALVTHFAHDGGFERGPDGAPYEHNMRPRQPNAAVPHLTHFVEGRTIRVLKEARIPFRTTGERYRRFSDGSLIPLPPRGPNERTRG